MDINKKHTKHTDKNLIYKLRNNKSVATKLQLEFGKQMQPITLSEASTQRDAHLKQSASAHNKQLRLLKPEILSPPLSRQPGQHNSDSYAVHFRTTLGALH